MRRGLAALLMCLAMVLGATGFFVLFGSLLAGQISDIIEDFPGYLDSFIGWINRTFHTELSRADIQGRLLRFDWLRTYVQKSAGGVFDFSASVLGGLVRLLTIFLFAFYFAVDGPGCAARCARCCHRPSRRRCSGPGRSRSTRRADTSTPGG